MSAVGVLAEAWEVRTGSKWHYSGQLTALLGDPRAAILTKPLGKSLGMMVFVRDKNKWAGHAMMVLPSVPEGRAVCRRELEELVAEAYDAIDDPEFVF